MNRTRESLANDIWRACDIARAFDIATAYFEIGTLLASDDL